MHSLMTQFLRDERGMAAEFALVLPLLLIFVVGMLDIGLYAWTMNRAEKATQVGARFAAVTDPLANEIATATYVNVNVGGTLVTQGDRIPAAALGELTCTDTGCTCTTGPCPGTTYNAAAFAALSTRMQEIQPAINDDNIEVSYTGSGLGYAGNPNGPDLSPIITVRLTDMTYSPLTLILFGADVDLPDFAYALTAEDSAGTVSN